MKSVGEIGWNNFFLCYLTSVLNFFHWRRAIIIFVISCLCSNNQIWWNPRCISYHIFFEKHLKTPFITQCNLSFRNIRVIANICNYNGVAPTLFEKCKSLLYKIHIQNSIIGKCIQKNISVSLIAAFQRVIECELLRRNFCRAKFQTFRPKT